MLVLRRDQTKDGVSSMQSTVYDLTCSDARSPVGIDCLPVFSWKYCLPAGKKHQQAYRIAVASSEARLTSETYDCWDSGIMESEASHFIAYAGSPLTPRTAYWWRVTVYDEDHQTCCAQSTFETGKRDERWNGRWIAASFHNKPDDAVDAPCLRKSFELASEPVRARLYICSPGYFDAAINGQSVSDEVLPTPFTKFDSQLQYCTYDVTGLLRRHDNAMGVMIGNGWYNCFTEDVWNSREATWRHIPKLIAELHVLFADGSREVIATDHTWQCAPGPITFNGIRNGEFYDARLEQPGWDTAHFDSADWEPAEVTRPTGGLLQAMEMEPIRITRRIRPVAHWQTSENAHVFDTGQNMAGIAEITVEGTAGDEITIRYAEKLHDDGVYINQKTVSGFTRSGEFQTDRYIKRGDGIETWRPRFVYHGFQFIEVSGCAAEPTVEALVLHTDVADSGSFSCADENLNKLQHATRWATLSNLHSIPTDDPHREKNAWTGDVALSAEQMLYNFHAVPLLRKWLADIRDAQKPDGALPCVVPSTGWGYNWGNGPDWSSALTLIPWQIYLYTGDRQILQQNYAAITRHFSYMESMAQDLIVSYGIGDWCPPFDGRAVLVNMASFKTPVALTDTAYFYNAADTIARMAAILELPEEALQYRRRADEIKQACRRRFYDADAQTIAGDCQTATACMIYQGLLEDDEQGPMLDLLCRQIADTGYHQDAGILGSKYLYNVLGAAGRMDLGLKMVLNETYPSFRNWMDLGATTLWECWNGEGSQNHHMFSDISACLYKYLGGIMPDEAEPGFRHIIMKPAVDCGLPAVKCSHESPFGTIAVHWQRGDGYAEFDIEIPGGSRASFGLPQAYDASDYPPELLPGRHHFRVARR
jgi:alpha-L-rhamnosidase